MKQFALGFHNYQSAYQAFPTYLNMAKTKVKSGLSWRVHILPFIGFNELYHEFKLDEAWDSPHNIKLLDKMPAIYLPTADMNQSVELKPYHTTYVAPIGKKTVFGQNEPVPATPSPLSNLSFSMPFHGPVRRSIRLTSRIRRLSFAITMERPSWPCLMAL
jgi:hypothetical protein